MARHNKTCAQAPQALAHSIATFKTRDIITLMVKEQLDEQGFITIKDRVKYNSHLPPSPPPCCIPSR